MTMRDRAHNEMMSSEAARLEIGHKLGYAGFEKGGALDKLYSDLLRATVKANRIHTREIQKVGA